MERKKYLFFCLIIVISIIYRMYINYFLKLDGLNIKTSLPGFFWVIIFLGQINLFLIFNILSKLVNYKVALFTGFLYAISPWIAYLEVSGSLYIVLLFILLLIFKTILKFSINKYFSIGFIFLIIFSFIYKFNEIGIFSNVGLINSVNEFRGETNKTIFAPIGKLVENRYIYLGEHVLFNILKQFTPATYFSNQAKLLDFSFSPPIFLGFLLPFLFGINTLFKEFKRVSIFYLLLFILLLGPSILSTHSPNLSSLVLISPIIFSIISMGLYQMILNFKNKTVLIILLITVFLVSLQFFSTVTDIATREPMRLKTHIENK